MSAPSSSGGRPPEPLPPGVPADPATSLPAPIIRLLVLFGRPIATLRAGIEIALWKPSRRVESWVMVLLWWALCLGGSYAFKWLLPPLLFAPLVPFERLRLKLGKDRTPPAHSTPEQPSSSAALLLTIADLHAIYALLPPSIAPSATAIYSRFAQLERRRLIRGLAIIWVGWVAVGYLVTFRALLALTGTAVLLYPSPPLAHLVRLLARSLAVRRAVAFTFLFVFGSPEAQRTPITSPLAWLRSKWAAARAPALALAMRAGPSGHDDDDELGTPAEPVYFRFEVHENQRWWMGLDWTSALLPQERPSWCDAHLLPVQPPPSFSLPPPSSIVLPAPTAKDPNAKVRRTATWKWVDEDWSIVRAGQGGAAATPVLPQAAAPAAHDGDDDAIGSAASDRAARRLSGYSTSGADEVPPASAAAGSSAAASHARAPSMAEQAFAKGLARLKAGTAASSLGASALGGSPSKSSSELRRGRTGSQASEDVGMDEPMAGAPLPDYDETTDAEGWVYGDNKWENMGAKGGLGKFTRRRRWQRRAVCIETLSRVLPSDPEYSATPATGATAADKPGTKPAPLLPQRSSSTSPTRLKVAPIAEVERDEGPGTVMPAAPARDEVLRQRLKKVMGNVGG